MPHKALPVTGELLAARIAEQTEVLAGLEPAVRADEPDAVHRMRVACRRLRSALRAYGPPLAGPEGELKWLGSVLGEARDCEVLGAMLTSRARELPPECDPEALAARITEWSHERYVRAWPQVIEGLDSPRYRALLATLRELAADPPSGKGLPPLRKLVRRAQRRTAARIKAARRAAPGAETEGALHEARKAAKRARYLGETAGRPARRFTARMKALQEVLGTHQDAVVAREALYELGRAGHGFGYGVLYGEQLAVAARAREQLPEVWRRAKKPPRFR